MFNYMSRAFAAFVLLIAGNAGAAVFPVPAGDAEALEQALVEASANGEADVIELAAGKSYLTDGRVNDDVFQGCSISSALPPIEGRVVINGNGAVIKGGEHSFVPVCILENADVTIRDLHFTDFEARGGVLLRNLGRLRLVRTTVSDSHVFLQLNFARRLRTEVIANGGTLSLENVTIVGNDAHGVRNVSEAEIRNTTIAGNAGDGLVGPDRESPDRRINVSVVNSIIAGNDGSDCEGRGLGLRSLGHNLDGDGTCGLDRPTDLSGVDPGFGAFGDHGGLVPTLALNADSPAIDGADAARCPSMDARGFVRLRGGDRGCDIGAFEHDGRARSIRAAHTATWFDPGHDGHFFTVQVIGDDRDQVLVHWNTFDESGDPVWLQGVGGIQGHRSSMVLHEYAGMRYPGFDPADRSIGPWGTLSLSFANCRRAVASYEPLDTALASGASRLVRLINTEGLSCGGGAGEAPSDSAGIGAAHTAAWYSPPEDGHFFTIQVLGDDRDQVLVHWNTFDAEGNPTWLQGVGEIDGHRTDMELYQYGGMRYPDFDPSDQSFRPWGTLELEFSGCADGTATYTPLDPDLPPADSPITRLINAKGLPCEG